MSIQRARCAWVGAGLLSLAVGSCFVKLGECVSQGVAIDPCVNPMRLGQTTTLQAHVDGAPGAGITWVLPAALQSGFQVTVGSTSLQLIGSSNVSGTYRVRAQSTSDASLFGEAFLTVAAQNFGYPPPPIQINGADFPSDYEAAVASGGGYYYLAYADFPDPLLVGGTDPNNFFVRQYSISTNVETAFVPDQFTAFQNPGQWPIEPNIAADCHGNGYWTDWDLKLGTVMRKLGPNGVLFPDQSLPNLSHVTDLVVACDGAIYFYADDCDDGCIGLFRMASFGAPPVELTLPNPLNQYAVSEAYGALAVDPEGRLLLGGPGAGAPFPVLPRLLRLIIDADSSSASFDPEFEFSLGNFAPFNQVDQVAVDGAGAIYAAVSGVPLEPGGTIPPPHILGINGLGWALFSIDDYVYHCPEGCDQNCGATLPFSSIQSLSAGTNGELFVVDDVFMGSEAPTECQVTVRMILLHP